VFLAEHQHQRGGQQRQQDRRDDQLLMPSFVTLPAIHVVGAGQPREASSTTRNSAVMAKLMTMAVSTSACGSGSV
jgi:hypothetical protein